jgi:hypothetical protein
MQLKSTALAAGGGSLVRVVILCAPDIAMGNHGGSSAGTRQGLLGESVFEDRLAPLVRTCTDADGASAGGFEARLAVVVAEPPEAQTRAEALLGMRS